MNCAPHLQPGDGSFSWIWGKPGARVRAAPGGGGPRGLSGPGQQEQEAAQLHHHLPGWKSSIFVTLKVASAFQRHGKVQTGRPRFWSQCYHV